MKHFTEKQIQIMRLALSLSGLTANGAGAETVLLVTSEIERLGDKFSLREATDIEYHIRNKYDLNLSPLKKKTKKK